jgi:hypothetical protein
MKGKLIMRIPDFDFNAGCCGYTWLTTIVEITLPDNVIKTKCIPEVVGIEWLNEEVKHD